MPSCGALKGDMNWDDSTCCAKGCADGSTPPATYDCDFCCQGNASCVDSCVPKTCDDLGMDCGEADDGCEGTVNCGPCDPGTDCDIPPLAGPTVSLDGNSLADDAGPFLGLSASLFWAAWAYKFDIEKLEQNLQFLADSGFNSFRALGVVGDVNNPDYWDGREIDPNWPDYAEVIAGVTDLAYDDYGLRVQWTLIGDGQVTVPTTAEKYALADTFLKMSKGREHKILLLETANEAWQNGFPGAAGEKELRELTAYLRASTNILVAASAPPGHECKDANAIYDGCIADIATIHFDRDIKKVEGSWRPVRQPWEHQYCGLPVGSNNEPIGPGASVYTETSPIKLVAGAVVTYISGLAIHVFHSSAGVLGFEDLMTMPGASAFAKLPELLPPDLSSWKPVNAHWNEAPFTVYAGDNNGDLHKDKMWVDLYPNHANGVVRAYGSLKGNNFLVFPIGILNSVTMRTRAGMDFAVINPITGATVACHSLAENKTFVLKGAEARLLKGTYWCDGKPCGASPCEVSEPECGADTCGPGFTCENGKCECGPAPSYKVIDGECLPSCGALKGAMNWEDSTCCQTGCSDGSTPPATHDCNFCCEGEASCATKPQGPVCGDGKCVPGEEDCATCLQDCPCPDGKTCSDIGQCYDPNAAPCGNGVCAPGVEDCGNCPQDCPCPGGTSCSNGMCI